MISSFLGPFLSFYALAAALALVSGCEEKQGSTMEGEGLDCNLERALVIRALDGDTLEVTRPCTRDEDCGEGGGTCEDRWCSSDPETIRLMAINTGEIPHHGGTDEKHHCMGDEAKETAERLALHTEVRLVYDPVAGCADRYGRKLAYVWADDVLVQERLLEQGLACIYWCNNEPDKEQTLYYERLVTAEERARGLGLGIWSPGQSACDGLPVHPDCL